MRTTRLNERDLTRIVRQVLREEDTDADMGVISCFKNTTIPKPFSCRGPALKGTKKESECLSDLGRLMTFTNHEETIKIMTCIVKPYSIPYNRIDN